MLATVREPTTYIDLTVGPYRLALRTDCVTTVVQDATRLRPEHRGEERLASAAAAVIRGRELPLIDLHDFDQPDGETIPFVVGVETEAGGCAIAADRIDCVGAADLRRFSVPPFGLQRPALFTEAIHDGRALLLVLDARTLDRLASARNIARKFDRARR